MSGENEDIDQTYLEKPFTIFLFKAYTSIYEKWVSGNIEGALTEALKLVVELPTDVKEALWKDKKKIEQDLDKAYRTQGVDWYTRQQNRNRAARRVAQHYIEPFLDKMTRLLDAKGWLERGALRPRYPSSKKLRV